MIYIIFMCIMLIQIQERDMHLDFCSDRCNMYVSGL